MKAVRGTMALTFLAMISATPQPEPACPPSAAPAGCAIEPGAEAASAADFLGEPAQPPLFPADRLVDGGHTPVSFCFAPGTDPAVMAYYNQLMITDPENTRYQLASRWSGAQGSPRALTWSFVPDGLSWEGSTSELFSRMDSLFAAQGGRATWIARIQSCFDRWAALTGTSYTRITVGGNDWDDGASAGSVGSATRGDVRIGMINIDGGSNVLAFNYFPSNGDMTLDRSENWASGAANQHRFLRNVIMHEHGHGLGIAHICSSNSGQLMEPQLSTAFDGPQDDDVRGCQRHYGDNFEANDSTAAATHVGAVDIGSPIVRGPVPAPNINFASIYSLDADGENDFFRFTVTGARSGTFTVTPVGRTYDNSPQNGDGSCSSGNNINSLTMANLNFEVLAPNGITVIASAAAQPAGVAETVSNVTLAAGDYYVRVFETGAPTEAQFYNLNITVSDLDCNQNGILDPCDINCAAPGCAVPGCGLSADCNANQLPDECEDCNTNSFADSCDIAAGTSLDCNLNATPDECEPADCNLNNTPDDCDIATAFSRDCNGTGVPDECEIAAGTSLDCNATTTPDECEVSGNDCNANTVPDECDIATAASNDCNGDTTPDECEQAANLDYDCNNNGTLDSCDLTALASDDCNTNGIPDECESENCVALWGGFEPDPPFGAGTFIHGIDSDGDGSAWLNPSSSATISNTGCPGGAGKALKSVAQVPNPADFFPLTSEFFRTVGGQLPPGSPIWSVTFDARTEASLNPRIDWQMSIRDGANNANVILLHWASTQSAFTGVSAAQRGRLLVQNPLGGSPAFLSTNFAFTLNTCYSVRVDFNNITRRVDVYVNGTLRLSTEAFHVSAQRMDYFKLEQRGNNQAAGGVNRLGLDNVQVCQTGAELTPGGAPDCNGNAVFDDCDIAGGGSVDLNGNGIPDECETPAATVTGAVSRKTCDLALVPPRQTEPRSGGITEVRIAFNVPPGGPGPTPITLEQATCAAPAFVAYGGAAVMSTGIVGNELVATFSPALEGLRTYRLSIAGSVTSVAGQFVEVRGLVGDVNSDGSVNALDRSVVVGAWTGGGFSCATDINGDAATNALDRSIVVGAWTGAANCAP